MVVPERKIKKHNVYSIILGLFVLSSALDMIINVPVVYMSQDVMILMRATSITRA
jgi:hypothetical protein